MRIRLQTLIVFFLVILSAATAYADPLSVPVNKDPLAAHAGAYVVEPVHTRVLFSVSHMGFTTWYGDFTKASGSLTVDPKHPAAARLDVEVPIASVSTTNARLDGESKGADWFNAARFPVARFVSRKIVPHGAGHADVTGDLTLHGITRSVTLHATFNGAGINPLDKMYTAGFEARGVIQRGAFGISKYVPLVGDDVELIISAAFEQKS